MQNIRRKKNVNNVYSTECEFGNYIFKVDKTETVLFDRTNWSRILYIMNRDRQVLFLIPLPDSFSKVFSTLLYVDYTCNMSFENEELIPEDFLLGFEVLDMMYPEINNSICIECVADSYYSFGHVLFHIDFMNKQYNILFTSHNNSSYLGIQEVVNGLEEASLTLSPIQCTELYDLSIVINDDLMSEVTEFVQNTL